MKKHISLLPLGFCLATLLLPVSSIAQSLSPETNKPNVALSLHNLTFPRYAQDVFLDIDSDWMLRGGWVISPAWEVGLQAQIGLRYQTPMANPPLQSHNLNLGVYTTRYLGTKKLRPYLRGNASVGLFNAYTLYLRAGIGVEYRFHEAWRVQLENNSQIGWDPMLATPWQLAWFQPTVGLHYTL